MSNNLSDRFAFDAERLRRIRAIEEQTEPGYRPNRDFYSYLRLFLVLVLIGIAVGYLYVHRESVIEWVRQPVAKPPVDTLPADDF